MYVCFLTQTEQAPVKQEPVAAAAVAPAGAGDAPIKVEAQA